MDINHSRCVKHILFLLDRYPTKNNSTCIFVKSLISSIADLGIRCTVIAPQIFKLKAQNIRNTLPYKMVDHAENSAEIIVYSPFYLHASSHRMFMGISMHNHTAAIFRTLHKHHLKPDAVYGHFIYQCGLSSAKIGKKLGIPSFLAVGESDRLDLDNKRNHGAYQSGLTYYGWKKTLNSLSGIICVSEYTKQKLIGNKFIDDGKFEDIPVLPNGVNTKLFHPLDKKITRKTLNYSEDDFIVIFVGAFNENKGVVRLAKAIDRLDDVKVIFIGKKGESIPVCKNILFSGQCDNAEIPTYLSSADVFVLPTRSEGCCNAIIEAMACGLPIISSDRPFNNGLLNSDNSIRIDPDNIQQIADAISLLKNEVTMRNKMGEASLVTAKELSIKNRAKKVIDYINKEKKRATDM